MNQAPAGCKTVSPIPGASEVRFGSNNAGGRSEGQRIPADACAIVLAASATASVPPVSDAGEAVNGFVASSSDSGACASGADDAVIGSAACSSEAGDSTFGSGGTTKEVPMAPAGE